VEPKTKKMKMKSKIIIIFLIIALSLAGYGYYWFIGVKKLQQNAFNIVNENASLKEQAKKLETLNGSLTDEYNRCEKFISQSVGDFGSFEYCKTFIQWINSQNLILK